MLRPHANRNVRPPLTSSPAPVSMFSLPSRARSRGYLPRRGRYLITLGPVAIAPVALYRALEFPIATVPPAAILATQGSLLPPRCRAASRARPPRDRPRRSDSARRPASTVLLLHGSGPRAPWPRPRQRTPRQSHAHPKARRLRRRGRTLAPSPSTAVDVHLRPRWRRRARAPHPVTGDAAVVLPGRACLSPGGHLCLPRPRLQGRILRSPFPSL